jgi:hypothetical protein
MLIWLGLVVVRVVVVAGVVVGVEEDLKDS